jgi:hypothetical protein
MTALPVLRMNHGLQHVLLTQATYGGARSCHGITIKLLGQLLFHRVKRSAPLLIRASEDSETGTMVRFESFLKSGFPRIGRDAVSPDGCHPRESGNPSVISTYLGCHLWH